MRRRPLIEFAAEYRAGSYLYDVTGYRAIFLNPSKKAGIIMRYQPPARQFLRPGFADHEGFFNGTFTRAFIFIVNTNLVASKDYPKSIPALLEPKYNKLVMDNESDDSRQRCLNITVKPKGKKSLKGLEDKRRAFAEGPLADSWLRPVSILLWSMDRITSPMSSKTKVRPSTIFFPNHSCR